jgi:hypothetical protein
MKNLIYLMTLAAMVLLVSCDELADKIEVGINTYIEADFPVVGQNAMTMELKSSQVSSDVYGFIGGGSFTLADIPELKKYMENLRSIVAEKGSIVKFAGVSDGNKILSLKLKFGMQITPGTEPVMLTAFDHSGDLLTNSGEISYLSDTWAPILIGALDANRDKTFIVKIEGTSNFKINSTVKVKIPVKVSATPL